MGTRADFYVREGKGADGLRWIGSVAYDGDWGRKWFGGIDSQSDFEVRCRKLAEDPKTGCKVEDGWPWPWETSDMSDLAYVWDSEKVLVSRFGGPLCALFPPEMYGDGSVSGQFPDMTAQKARRPTTKGLFIGRLL